MDKYLEKKDDRSNVPVGAILRELFNCREKGIEKQKMLLLNAEEKLQEYRKSKQIQTSQSLSTDEGKGPHDGMHTAFHQGITASERKNKNCIAKSRSTSFDVHTEQPVYCERLYPGLLSKTPKTKVPFEKGMANDFAETSCSSILSHSVMINNNGRALNGTKHSASCYDDLRRAVHNDVRTRSPLSATQSPLPLFATKSPSPSSCASPISSFTTLSLSPSTTLSPSSALSLSPANTPSLTPSDTPSLTPNATPSLSPSTTTSLLPYCSPSLSASAISSVSTSVSLSLPSHVSSSLSIGQIRTLESDWTDSLIDELLGTKSVGPGNKKFCEGTSSPVPKDYSPVADISNTRIACNVNDFTAGDAPSNFPNATVKLVADLSDSPELGDSKNCKSIAKQCTIHNSKTLGKSDEIFKVVVGSTKSGELKVDPNLQKLPSNSCNYENNFLYRSLVSERLSKSDLSNNSYNLHSVPQFGSGLFKQIACQSSAENEVENEHLPNLEDLSFLMEKNATGDKSNTLSSVLNGSYQMNFIHQQHKLNQSMKGTVLSTSSHKFGTSKKTYNIGDFSEDGKTFDNAFQETNPILALKYHSSVKVGSSVHSAVNTSSDTEDINTSHNAIEVEISANLPFSQSLRFHMDAISYSDQRLKVVLPPGYAIVKLTDDHQQMSVGEKYSQGCPINANDVNCAGSRLTTSVTSTAGPNAAPSLTSSSTQTQVTENDRSARLVPYSRRTRATNGLMRYTRNLSNRDNFLSDNRGFTSRNVEQVKILPQCSQKEEDKVCLSDCNHIIQSGKIPSCDNCCKQSEVSSSLYTEETDDHLDSLTVNIDEDFNIEEMDSMFIVPNKNRSNATKPLWPNNAHFFHSMPTNTVKVNRKRGDCGQLCYSTDKKFRVEKVSNTKRVKC